MIDNKIAHAWYIHRVSYGETDTMGYLYYGEYLHIFERARGELMRKYSMTYAEFEKNGFMLPVREASCRYRNPAVYDDNIQIYLEVAKMTRASITFNYTVYDETRTKLHCTGMTEHACTNKDGKPIAFPAFFRDIYGQGL